MKIKIDVMKNGIIIDVIRRELKYDEGGNFTKYKGQKVRVRHYPRLSTQMFENDYYIKLEDLL